MSGSYVLHDRALAFAGIFQGARLAQDIARSGICDAAAFEASRDSLFEFSPDSVDAVFGGTSGVALGMRTLLKQLERPAQRDLEISRYAIAVLHLADRLRRDDDAMQALYDDLKALERRRTGFELGDSTLHEQFGEIYQTHISTLGPRIMIKGEPLHLQNPDNAARIRVALLAAVRAAVLWRQTGGRKWHVLLRRRAITTALRELIDKTDL
jgi:high frequency lysogenization protein